MPILRTCNSQDNTKSFDFIQEFRVLGYSPMENSVGDMLCGSHASVINQDAVIL